jgi:hypothetical protein
MTALFGLSLSELLFIAGHETNKWVILRITLLMGIVTQFIFFQIFDSNYIIKRVIINILITICLALGIYSYFFNEYSRYFLIYVLIISFINLLADTDVFIRWIRRKEVWMVTLLVAPLSIFLLVNSNKYLNNESFPSKYYVEILKSIDSDAFEDKKNDLKIQLTSNEYNIVSKNIELSHAYKSKYIPPLIQLNKTNGIVFENNLQRGGVACLLGRYESKINKFKTIDECFEWMLKKSRLGYKSILLGLDKIDFIVTDEKVTKIYKFFSTRNYGEIKSIKDDQIEKILGYSFNIGGYFHHYQSLVRSQFDDSLNLDNQYGIGPVLLVYIIGKLFQVSAFDALYLSTIICALMIYACVFFINYSIKPKEDGALVNLGFAISIALVFFGSNLMAPMLYSNRYLPTLMLSSLIFYCWLKEKDCEKIPFPLLLVISIYNFEFSLLTFCALVLADWTKGFKAISRYFIFILISIAVQYFSRSGVTESADYFSYLSGISLQDFPNLIVVLYFSLIFIMGFALKADAQATTIAYRRIYFIVLLFSLKYIWNGSFNHIGFNVLMISYALVILLKSEWKYRKIVVNLFVLAFVFTVLQSLYVAQRFNLNSNMNSFEYVESKISRYYKIENELVKAGEEFSQIANKYDDLLLLSPKDNFMMLYSNKLHTGNKPDLSTNLNSFKDINSVAKYFSENVRQVLVVDRSIIEANQILDLYAPYVYLSSNIIHQFNLYKYNLGFQYQLFNQLKFKSSLYECERTSNFIVYCRKDN